MFTENFVEEFQAFAIATWFVGWILDIGSTIFRLWLGAIETNPFWSTHNIWFAFFIPLFGLFGMFIPAKRFTLPIWVIMFVIGFAHIVAGYWNLFPVLLQ